jgi:hypothetical protein
VSRESVATPCKMLAMLAFVGSALFAQPPAPLLVRLNVVALDSSNQPAADLTSDGLQNFRSRQAPDHRLLSQKRGLGSARHPRAARIFESDPRRQTAVHRNRFRSAE